MPATIHVYYFTCCSLRQSLDTRRGELHIRPGHAASEEAALVRLFRSAATL